MSGIYLPYQKSPRWNIDRATIALNCARLGLSMPVLAMPFWEGSGNKVFDYSGNRNDGTLSGSDFAWSAGAAYFNSSAQVYFRIESPFQFSDDAPWSIVFCIQPDLNATSNQGFVLGDAAGYNSAVWFRNNNTSSQKIRFRNDDGVYSDLEYYPTGGAWHKCVLTSDGAGAGSSTLKFYTDLPDTNGKIFTSVGSVSSGWLFRDIGCAANNITYNFYGKLNYVYLFNCELTAIQAQTLYNDPSGMFEPIKSPQWIVPLGATTVAPTTAAPTTSAPTTGAPTAAPTSLAPTSLAPTSLAPTTAPPVDIRSAQVLAQVEWVEDVSTTGAPTTLAPTSPPTTLAPTAAPTTLAPTSPPTTLAPTAAPTTLAPTTSAPTTSAPTTAVPTEPPTTLAPTLASTTLAPTTIAPTLAPTSLAPTTSTLTTLAPTTNIPEEICIRPCNSPMIDEILCASIITKELTCNGNLC